MPERTAVNTPSGAETPATEYFETCSKKGRGMAQRSLDLIEAMHAAAEAAQPITGRGIGYKLFVAGLVASMSRNDMQKVYRLLKEALPRVLTIKPCGLTYASQRQDHARPGTESGACRLVRIPLGPCPSLQPTPPQ